MSKPIEVYSQPDDTPQLSEEELSSTVGNILDSLNDDPGPEHEDINNQVSDNVEKEIQDFELPKFEDQVGAEEAAEEAEDVEQDVSEEEGEIEAEVELDDSVFLGKVLGEDGEEQEISIPKGAIFTVTVDGEDQEMSLQEIKNGISGERALSQRFSVLDQSRKELEARQENWNQLESKILNDMASGNHTDALDTIFKQAGYNSEVALAGLIVELLPTFEKLQEMSGEERSSWIYNVDKAQKEELLKQKDTELNKLRSESTQKSQLDSLRTEKGLNDDQISLAYSRLLNGINSGSINLTKDQVTVEHLGIMHDFLEREQWVETAFADIDLSPSEKEDAITLKLKKVQALQNAGEAYNADKVLKEVQSEYASKAQTALKEKSKKVAQVLEKKGHKKISGGNEKQATTKSLDDDLGFSIKDVAERIEKNNDNFLF